MSNGPHSYASDGNYTATTGGVQVEVGGVAFAPVDFFHQVHTAHLDVDERADIRQLKVYGTGSQIEFGTTSGFNTIISATTPAANQTVVIPDSGVATVNAQLGVRVVKTLTENSALTLTTADSGCLVMMPQSTHAADSTHNVVNLPAPKAGFHTRVVFTTTGDNTAGHDLWVSSTGANMSGSSIGVTAGLVATVIGGVTTIKRSGTAANTKAGDYIDISSDGTNYYIFAYSSGAANPYTTA